MSIIDRIKSLFGRPEPYPEAIRLNATSLQNLRSSLSDLEPGKQGWIENAESERLFLAPDLEIGNMVFEKHCSWHRSGDRIYFKKN